MRLRGLDGVRGVAAAMVVVHHLALSGGWLSDPFATQPNVSSGFERAMTYTPLHLVWAGGEAVFVFFVLSGYVLAGTDISTPRRTAGFVGKRFVRLYVPAAAAIVLATAQHALDPPAPPGEQRRLAALARDRRGLVRSAARWRRW